MPLSPSPPFSVERKAGAPGTPSPPSTGSLSHARCSLGYWIAQSQLARDVSIAATPTCNKALLTTMLMIFRYCLPGCVYQCIGTTVGLSLSNGETKVWARQSAFLFVPWLFCNASFNPPIQAGMEPHGNTVVRVQHCPLFTSWSALKCAKNCSM